MSHLQAVNDGILFFNHSGTLFLFMGEFNPFTSKVIIDR